MLNEDDVLETRSGGERPLSSGGESTPDVDRPGLRKGLRRGMIDDDERGGERMDEDAEETG